MKHILFTVLTLVLLMSCNDKKKSNQKFLPDASGAINSVSVVTENEIWDGRVGDAIRSVLAKPIYGLPQDEPTFTISQIPTSVFSGFVTKNRTVLKIEMNKEAGIQILEDVYAIPQKVIVVSGKSREAIIKVLEENESKIIETFRNEELAERQRQMSKSPHTFTIIKESLGLTVDFASIYRIAKKTDDFFWIRKDITTGTNNLMIYELPLDAIKRNDSVVNQIIKIRDSIGKVYIEGPVEGSYMVTEDAYAPFISETILDNKPAFETKGIWDVKNAFMGGPFINYAIEDKINKRWVVIEGFAFAPSVEKRNYMLELESIIKSVKID
jgi:hypothetical protein